MCVTRHSLALTPWIDSTNITKVLVAGYNIYILNSRGRNSTRGAPPLVAARLKGPLSVRKWKKTSEGKKCYQGKSTPREGDGAEILGRCSCHVATLSITFEHYLFC